MQGILLWMLMGRASAQSEPPAVRVEVNADNLTIRVQDEETTLSWGTPGRLSEELHTFSRTLHRLQQNHTDSETLVLAPSVPVTYPELTALMDAARALTLDSRSLESQTTLVLFEEVILEALPRSEP